MGILAVMGRDAFTAPSLTYLLSYLFTSLRIGPVHFHTRGRKRRPNLALVLLCLFSAIVYLVMDACLFLLC